LYTSAVRKINYPCKGLVKKEGYSIKGQLANILVGAPDLKPDQYLIHSSYSANDSFHSWNMIDAPDCGDWMLRISRNSLLCGQSCQHSVFVQVGRECVTKGKD